MLGASLHDVLTRLKAEPQNFSKLDLAFSSHQPIEEPVILTLPSNGIRLRFDGPEQRLRLIEVLDFSKNKLTYNGVEVAKASGAILPSSIPLENISGPYFRHVYNKLLGPTFPGEYVPPDENDDSEYGLYVLSYPGIAFSFPLLNSAWPIEKDFVSLLSSSSTQPAACMAIFDGNSWAEARQDLYTKPFQDPRMFPHLGKTRETYAEEISQIKLYGQGRLEMKRTWINTPFWVILGETTPQDLVAELGPPDAIYRRNDKRMQIHKARTGSESRARPNLSDSRLQDDSTDTDQSSAHTTTDASDEDSDSEGNMKHIPGGFFYNYFYHGFDILISAPMTPSRCPPSLSELPNDARLYPIPTLVSAPLVASKVIIHSNVPGSYSFNRHKRCRWEIAYLTNTTEQTPINSETPFEVVAKRLQDEWKSIYANPEEASQLQRGMVLNRGWDDSPGSSCELLGSWESSFGGKRTIDRNDLRYEEQGPGNTTLYGYPGLVFEVLKNGIVSGLTVF